MISISLWFPTCQVRVVGFYQNVLPPPPNPPLLLPSSSSPDITCHLVSAVRLAGLHLPPRWIASAVCWSPHSSDFCSAIRSVGLAGLVRVENRCGPRRTFTARKSLWASPVFLRQIECQVECRNICQIECQKERQIECQKECQKECQIERQMECQLKCQR